MVPMVINFSKVDAMRRKYKLAVAAAPFALMFGSFLPLYCFGLWLEKRLGIPHGSPIKDHPNGKAFIDTFMVVMVVLMLAGYVAGWLVNAVVARYALRWPGVARHRGVLALGGPRALVEGPSRPRSEVRPRPSGGSEPRRSLAIHPRQRRPRVGRHHVPGHGGACGPEGETTTHTRRELATAGALSGWRRDGRRPPMDVPGSPVSKAQGQGAAVKTSRSRTAERQSCQAVVREQHNPQEIP